MIQQWLFFIFKSKQKYFLYMQRENKLKNQDNYRILSRESYWVSHIYCVIVFM